MSRLSKEMEERIRRYRTYLLDNQLTALDNQLTADVSSLLGEIDALRAGRDEAILGAYRAAAEHEPIMGDDSPHGDAWIQCSCGWSPDSSLTWTAHILALTHTPESGE